MTASKLEIVIKHIPQSLKFEKQIKSRTVGGRSAGWPTTIIESSSQTPAFDTRQTHQFVSKTLILGSPAHLDRAGCVNRHALLTSTSHPLRVKTPCIDKRQRLTLHTLVILAALFRVFPNRSSTLTNTFTRTLSTCKVMGRLESRSILARLQLPASR